MVIYQQILYMHCVAAYYMKEIQNQKIKIGFNFS